VISLFNKQYFTIVHWTSDVSRKHEGIQVESDKEPDLRIRYNPTGDEFYVECKFRSGLNQDGKLNWVSSDYTFNRYQKFGERLPFFIVVGLGGNYQHPKQMFCIPLKEARWKELYPSVFDRYERIVTKQFYWKMNDLR
jgi:hypothetical protein